MATSRPASPRIRQLPANLVNQIAAGEVIERPASVVKELLENCIDAGAGRIEVAVSGGGTELIRVSDDGCGISAEQLALAVNSHATSKLTDDQALFHVSTLGFRGEALASIGSVSHLTIRSRTSAEDAGSEISVRGGVVESPVPCGCPVGTVVEVRNLFFNTPVRHRFLKTTSTEKSHLTEAFTRLALANPDVHFVLTHNDRPLYDLPATTRWADRIQSFFGAEIAESLIAVHSEDDGIDIQGYVCDPAVSRGNNRMQYLFLNGRHVRDRALQHALGEAYRGMLMVGRHPVCFLRLQMAAELVDVNVHPTKLEVRFTDGGRVYSRLLQTLRHRFLTANLTQRVGPAVNESGDPARGSGTAESSVGLPSALEQQQRQSVIDWARTGDSTSNSTTPSSATSSEPSPARNLDAVPEFRPYGSDVSTLPPAASNFSRATDIHPDVSTDHQSVDDDRRVEEQIGNGTFVETPTFCPLGFQVHNRYLVTQDEAGMVIIDQHALHERVLYEQICDRVLREGKALESQKLLVPEPVALTPTERSAALDAKDALLKAGIEIDDFGGESVLIHAYPAMLGNASPEDMLRTLLEAILSVGKRPDPQDILNHLLSTIACKAAVKAGDRLTREEVTSLLEQRDLYHDTHHCPHGRPTALCFSRDELDRMFGRLGPRSRSQGVKAK